MFILYLTRNLINGKIYVGVHKQKIHSFDGYWGSGLLLLNARKKYGDHNFIRETLRECETSFEAYELEAFMVDKNFISRDDTYNQKEGGRGGWLPNFGNKHNLGRKHTPESRLHMGESHLGKKHSPESIQLMREIALNRPKDSEETRIAKSLGQKKRVRQPWSAETRKKMSESAKKAHKEGRANNWAKSRIKSRKSNNPP